PSAAELIDRNLYQAVFLANGSTYFGKLQEQGSDWFVLTDVFYISVSDQSGTQLIKRGTEPQGPKEPMIISRQQVLFIENMRDDSDIVTLIKKFKSGQLPTATPPPPTVTPTTGRPSASPSPSRSPGSARATSGPPYGSARTACRCETRALRSAFSSRLSSSRSGA